VIVWKQPEQLKKKQEMRGQVCPHTKKKLFSIISEDAPVKTQLAALSD
jgi:hypothetical protein